MIEWAGIILGIALTLIGLYLVITGTRKDDERGRRR